MVTSFSKFNPIQPRFKEGGCDVVYRELTPDTMLAEHVCSYWELVTLKPLENSFTYNAVSDGCIDFFFDRLSNHDENYVMGFSSSSTAFDVGKVFHYMGIRFYPGAFPMLFKVDASELTNQCFRLRDVIPVDQPNVLNDERSISLEEIKIAFDNFFKKKVSSVKTNADPRFLEARSIILNSAAPLQVEQLTVSGISERHLRRLFDFYIGTGPREFQKVMRFQRFLKASKGVRSLRNDKSFLDHGYFDQSHFIKDYKKLYGAAPLKTVL